MHQVATMLLIVADSRSNRRIFSLSQATAGVGLLALACYIGILGRILQADSYHRAMMAVFGEDLLHNQ